MKKLDMEEAAKRRKLAIEATNADTKAKEAVLAIMSVNLTNTSPKRRIWSANRQKEMFDQDILN